MRVFAKLLERLQKPRFDPQRISAGRYAPEQLGSALRNQRGSVRIRAYMQLLETSSKAHAAVPALIDALNDSRDDVRAYAIRVLGAIGDQRAVPILARILRDEGQDLGLRRWAAVSLGQMAPPGAIPLIESLSGDDSRLRVLAAKAVAGMPLKTADSIDALIRAAMDDHPAVRIEAVKGLWALGAPPEKREEVTAAVVEALNDPEHLVQKQALSSLSFALGAHEVAIPIFLELLASGKPDLTGQSALALAMAEVPAWQVVPKIIDVLDVIDGYERILLVQALGKYGVDAELAVPALVDLLGRRDYLLCHVVTETLEQIGPGAREALPALRGLFDDDEFLSRGLAESSRSGYPIVLKQALLKAIDELE
jgi:HEAT repeat protein